MLGGGGSPPHPSRRVIGSLAPDARSDLFERRQQLMDDWAAYLTDEPG